MVLVCLVPVQAKETWTSVRTPNFFLIGNTSEKDVRQVAQRLEQFREVLTLLFKGMNFSATVPTTVVVFKSHNSYGPFKPNANTAGYFQAGSDVNYITLTTELWGEQNPFTVIFHEYTHLLINNTIGTAPNWFNEGLAEYYSTFQISEDRKIVLGSPISSHVFLLRDKMLPLRTLFQVDHKSPYYNESDKQSIFYAQSWALVHYLILGNEGKRVDQIVQFIKLLDTGVPMEEAFEKAFQSTFEKMEKELRDYVKKDRYPIIKGSFAQKVGVETQMQTAVISEAEAQAYLGDMLLHSHRADCEKYLLKALKLDPEQPLANASLAMLRVREGKLDEARKGLERAVQANSQNYLIRYYYAFVLSREGMNETQQVNSYSPATLEKIRGELKKAIELRPDFSESYALLAFVNLVDGSQLDETTEMLKRGLKGSPGRNDLLLMLAQIYLRQEDYQSSRQILQRLSQNASDAEVAEQAKTMLAQLQDYEQQLERYKSAREEARKKQSSTTGLTVVSTGDAPAAVLDPSSYLREALRSPETDEKQIQGLLLRVECDAKGISFFIQAGSATLKLRAAKFEDISIVAFTNDAGGEITCGQRKPPDAVVVCYVPTTDQRLKVDGKLTSLEFVPKDFKLNH
jgi:tetratricopeptide (TPR) repeat protein